MNTSLAEGLRGFVAETFALMAKTQACHWNAIGENFIGMHKLTEAQYAELLQAADDLAERMRGRGDRAPLGLAEMQHLSTIEDAPVTLSTHEALRILAEDNATLAELAKDLAEHADEADDLATHDMLVHRIAVHQKAAWLLRSHVARD